MSEQYRVVKSPMFNPVQLALAPRYSDIVGAVFAMKDGIVVNRDGTRLVAFHEKHLEMIERLS